MKRDDNSGELNRKKHFPFIKIFISLIFGFLPSFLFVVAFVQYGSLFSNYTKFLFSESSSLGVWISAIGIALFVYFILGLIRPGVTFKKIISNKPVLIILIMFIILILGLVAVQLYLYVNFNLRNDILVELSVDEENIIFTDEVSEDVTFKIDLTMNPFCSAHCEYEFLDIGYDEEIEVGSFNITSILSKSRTYTINNNNLVDGSQEIKRFEVTCKSKRTLLCYTREEESKRAILITVNYALDDDEIIFKNESKNDIINLKESFYFSGGRLREISEDINSINNLFYVNYFSTQYRDLHNLSQSLNLSLENVQKLWRNQDFDFLRSKLSEIKIRMEYFENKSKELTSNLNSNISFYNNLTEILFNSRNLLEEASKQNLTNQFCKDLSKTISDYNNAITDFKNESSLSIKKIITDKIVLEVANLYASSQSELEEFECVLNEKVIEEDLKKINIISINLHPISFLLDEPTSICCLFGKCEKCCDEGCSDQNYPIIFLHGQSINEAVSVGFSLDTFSKFKTNLTSRGYIDAGAIILGSTAEKGLWGKTNAAMIMTGSYFFDTYKTQSGETTVSSNQEGIDTYAIRLKKIIELVKFKTNKNKVIIVAHSMGGVVTRRYIQLFGGNDLDKAILVTAPNHGVSDKISEYCGVIGPEVSCSELKRNSLFMNQLNSEWTTNVPLYNIIGIGCDMGDETGEGVVKNSSQYIENAINYYFKGACNELNFEFFHEYIIDPDKYPEVYNKIYEILKNSNF